MCIGIPMRVLESNGATALCEGRGERRNLNMLMVGDCPPGSWVLSSLGCARDLLTEDDAARINCALDGLQAAMRGDACLERHFADLASRHQARTDEGAVVQDRPAMSDSGAT